MCFGRRQQQGGGEKVLAGLKTQRRKLAAGSGYLPRVESAAVISDNEMQNLTKLFVRRMHTAAAAAEKRMTTCSAQENMKISMK
jgi:hypothetical protein